MLSHADLEALSCSLPEGVLSLRYAGLFDRERTLIDDMLSRPLPSLLRKRLEIEREASLRTEAEYTVSYDRMLTLLRARSPRFTAEELDALIADGRADWRLREGRVFFHEDCFEALHINALRDIYHTDRATTPEDDRTHAYRREILARMKRDGGLAMRHHIRHTVVPTPAAREPGRRILVHIPLPAETEGQRNLRILDSTPGGFVSDAAQRTISFDTVDRGQDFFVEYSFEAVQPWIPADPAAVLLAQPKAYTGEEGPHIRFTPFLRALAREIVGDEHNALFRARRIYDWITQNVRYSYMRNYLLFDNIPEFAALNRRGDCGVQALLFITLCRISGIGADWESGLGLSPGRVGSHDWARYYVAPFGWLHADLSRGGGALQEAGDEELWDFYARCIGPERVITCTAFQREFDPPRRYLRIDPFDNQSGEIEYEDRGLGSRERRSRRENLGSEVL